MIDYSEDHFRELCRADRVSIETRTFEEKRRRALRQFWLYLLGGIALAAAIAWSLFVSGWEVTAFVLAFAVLIGAVMLALRALGKVGLALKQPVLETLAEKGGMEYLPSGFEPPVFPTAGRTLFGGISSYSFTDLFHGTDADGRRFAVYEGTLSRRQGKNTVTVFTGQIYAFQRRSRVGGETAIVPDKGIFNFFKPKGMERVKFESDPDFEKKFEVYSTHPPTAMGLVGTDVRRHLLQLRQAGRVFAYVGEEDVLVALWGKNRFEPGSMFRARSGEERVRLMFDDVCASMGVLRTLKKALD